MYVAEARFVLARPPASIDLASLATLPFVERIDPAIKHQLITSAEAISAQGPTRHATTRIRCGAGARRRPATICIRSRYKFEGKLPIGIPLANKLRESAKKISDYLEFESELRLRPAGGGRRDGARAA